MPAPITDAVAYFNDHAQRIETGCWIWTGARTKAGYGQPRVNRQRHYAHRFSYELHHQPIPPGLHVCHRCDVPACVNPDHLFAATHLDNMRDMDAKGRRVNSPKHGTEHHQAKLTDDEVRDIRVRVAAGERLQDIGDLYGVVKTNVSMIARRITWRHVA